MMDFIKWTFEKFWRFIGVVILLGVLLGGITDGLLALRGKADPGCSSTELDKL